MKFGSFFKKKQRCKHSEADVPNTEFVVRLQLSDFLF